MMDHLVYRVREEISKQYGHMMIRWYEIVNWKEPLIWGLMMLHLVLLTLVITLRNVYRVQVVLFALICGTIALSEHINAWGRLHWKSFATQQYFDQHGIFMGIFVAGPLLLTGFVQLVLNMRTMANLVVTVKRHEMNEYLKSKGTKQE
jgi:hypothetical protein